MLEIPEEIKALFRENNNRAETQKKFKLKFYNEKIESLYPYETLFPSEDLFPSEQDAAWLIIEDDRIVTESLVITEALSESDNLEFGSCNATRMEIVVADVAEDITGKEFTLTVEIGGYEMAMGIYTVESFIRQADRRKRKITAYDRMNWFDTDVSVWYNELSFPMTLRAFRDSLCAYIGVQQDGSSLPLDSMQVTKTIEPEQILGRDVLKAICQINGCFGHVDKTGELKYIQPQQTGLYPAEDLFPSVDLYPAEFGGDGEPVEIIDRYKNLTYEDYLVDGITGLVIRQQEGDIGANVGTGENPYAIEGNFLVYGKSPTELLAIASAILPLISEKTYCPATLECNAMPWVEVGDAIRAVTRDDLVETFVMKRVTKGCQAMFDQISSTGTKSREETFGIHKQIIQLEGKAAIITKNVEEVSVQVTDLKNYTESQFDVTAKAINAEVKRAEEAESALRITANTIALSVTNLREDTNTRFELTDKEIDLKVSIGDVTNKLNSELKITGSTIELSTGNVIIDSKNFKLDKSGNATFSGTVQSAAIKASAITGGSINISGKADGKDYSFGVNTSGQLSWNAVNSSMAKDGTITCKKLSATEVSLSGTINATSGKIAGFTIDGSSLKADSSNSEIRGGNIITPSLMVGYTNNVIFSAVGDGNGEIIARTNINMTNHSFNNLNNLTAKKVTVDTNEWSMSPYNNEVGTILDAIWNGGTTFMGLDELRDNVEDLQTFATETRRRLDDLEDAVFS